jgi:hypothetical protein
MPLPLFPASIDARDLRKTWTRLVEWSRWAVLWPDIVITSNGGGGLVTITGTSVATGTNISGDTTGYKTPGGGGNVEVTFSVPNAVAPASGDLIFTLMQNAGDGNGFVEAGTLAKLSDGVSCPVFGRAIILSGLFPGNTVTFRVIAHVTGGSGTVYAGQQLHDPPQFVNSVLSVQTTAKSL